MCNVTFKRNYTPAGHVCFVGAHAGECMVAEWVSLKNLKDLPAHGECGA